MSLSQERTLSDPYEMNVVTSVSTDQEIDTCFTGYKLENALFTAYGDKETYVSNYTLKENKEAIGIRPVITVKKK